MEFNNSTNMAYLTSHQQNASVDGINPLNAAIEHAEMAFRMGEAWNTMSAQLHQFNQIVAISIDSFRGWSLEERITLVNLMR